MANIGWLFYKNYYLEGERGMKVDYWGGNDNSSNERLFNIRNEELWKQEINPKNTISDLPCNEKFQLKTTYPGLIIGSGYNHGTGKLGELKLGFYFDHTTGMPIIPGSSVKGLLRSKFPGMDLYRHYQLVQKKGKAEEIEASRNHYDEKMAYAQYLLAAHSLSDAQVLQLEWELFGGKLNYVLAQHPETKAVTEKGDNISIPKRDIYLDAPIVGPSDKAFLASDYITPHKEALKNPVPISFLKVRPNIVFEFRFKLQDSPQFPAITAKVKKDLFEQILLEQGIGAKTNVGYGQFVNP